MGRASDSRFYDISHLTRLEFNPHQGPYVRSGDNDLIPRISSILRITVKKKWCAGSGNSPIQATQSGVKLFPNFAHEDNSQFKMAAVIYRRYLQRRVLRKNQIFRDRSHHFEKFDDMELFQKFRFRRFDILAIMDSIRNDIELANHRGSLTPLLQVMVALRLYASYQDVYGELIGIDQSTVNRTIPSVTEALLHQLPNWVQMPSH